MLYGGGDRPRKSLSTSSWVTFILYIIRSEKKYTELKISLVLTLKWLLHLSVRLRKYCCKDLNPGPSFKLSKYMFNGLTDYATEAELILFRYLCTTEKITNLEKASFNTFITRIS